MLFNIFDPKVTRVERLLIRDVEANNDALRLSVVHPSDLAEALLTSCIPDEEAHMLPLNGVPSAGSICRTPGVDLDCFYFEVVCDGGLCAVLRKHLGHVALNE